jgi:hypothetical protein
LPYLLVRVFKIDDSWCIGKKVWRIFWILNFFHFTSLNMCSNLDGNINFPLKPCRWPMILIAIGQELMETLLHAYKTNLMHILPPGLWSRVETIANKPNTPLRSQLVA